MSTKRAAAHDAARRGFDVFPITPNAKKPPLFSDWQNKATQDPKQIDAWWDQWPDANIGHSTRDRIVIDVDPRNGGKDTFTALAMIEEFDKTLRSKTAGGGDHIIYATREPVKGGNNKLGPGVDIKAHGGYILLPGSTVDGNAYEWGNARPIAPAMPWLVDRCNKARPKSDAAGERIAPDDDIARELAEKWLVAFAPRAETGNIDNTTYQVAAKCGDFGCGYETTLDLMLDWNETHVEPPQALEDLERVVSSAMRNRENPIGKLHSDASGFEVHEIEEPKTALVKPGKFYAIRADESSRLALEQRGEPLIRGIIDSGTMSVLVGKGGGGKTFLALDWSYHIATGREWASKRVKQGAVVYLAAEAGNMIHSRIKALEAHYGALGAAPLFIIPCPANFSRGPDDVKAIIELIKDCATRCGQKVELFVVDTLARVMTGDENSAKDMGVVIEAIDFIRNQVGCHGMLIHHPNKAGTSARGSGNVFGAIDTEMWVDEHKVLSFTKQRDLPLGKDIRFKLKVLQLGSDADGEPITSCVVHVPKAGEAEARGELNRRLSDIWSTLSAALEDAGKDTFDMAFLRTITFRHSSDTALKRTTLATWMSELSENGYLRKNKFGQWVRESVESVELCRNLNSQEVSENPMPLGRGSAHRPDLLKRKRAKRRTKNDGNSED